MLYMPNLKLKPEEVKRLMTSSILDFGAEAIICNPGNGRSLYKIFRNDQNPITMSENKAKKIAKLYRKRLSGTIHPISTISMNGELIGYEMTYNPEYIVFEPFQIPRDETIHFLEKSKEILQNLSQEGIVYGDVAKRNILVNRRTGQVKFCDMDNIQLDDLPIDLLSRALKEYSAIRGIDSCADAYMHSLMTLHSFDLDENYCFQSEFDYHFTRQAKKVLFGIRNKEKYNGEYIVQYVKKR